MNGLIYFVKSIYSSMFFVFFFFVETHVDRSYLDTTTKRYIIINKSTIRKKTPKMHPDNYK